MSAVAHRRLADENSLDEVLRFWFGDADDPVVMAKRQANLWWNKSADADAEIRARFGTLRGRAIRGELDDSWAPTSRGRLGLIILVDQMSRHMFRDEAEAFRHDPMAREWCSRGIELRADEELGLLERVFFYVPLEHSESRDDQAWSVDLYAQLKNSIPASERELFSIFLLFELSARRHRAVVDRFGRFPHRNRALGRSSSQEEIAFLEQPGSSF
ncbi:MAG: DUF924 family protein [Steroidobacteraceae bacterium]